MRVFRQINQYWPITVIAGVVVLGIPLLGIRSDLTGSAGGKAIQDNKDIIYKGSGYAKDASAAQIFGFDGVTLQAPMFQSWFDASKPEAKFSELKANTLLVGKVWKENQGTKEKNFRKLQELRKSGMRILMQVTEMADWVTVEGTEVQQHSFSLARAARVFAQAKRAGVEKVADMIVLGSANEEVSMYANQAQRKKMYELAKQYFPSSPIVQRYGVSLEKPEGLNAQSHPVGGIWNEYQFGADECDLAMIVMKHINGAEATHEVESINEQITLLKSRHSEVGVLVTVQTGSPQALQTDSTAMINSKDLEVLGAALLHSSAVDGLLFRGLGEFQYDFGNPQFSAQRNAISRMAPAAGLAKSLQSLNEESRAPASVAVGQ